MKFNYLLCEFIFIIFFTLSLTAKNKEPKNHREHGAHSHGSATLGLVFDKSVGQIEFKTPSEAIIGFEYAPKTKKDIQIKSDRLAKLEKEISLMIVFEKKLGCEISTEKIDVQSDGLKSKDSSSRHSDVIASFKVNCKQSPVDSKLTFNIQKYFPHIKDLDVQIVIGDFQKSIEVKKDSTSIQLSK